MDILGLIPARFASKRFPGKLLQTYRGTSILEHTYRRARDCREVSDLYVVTSDQQIEEHCVDKDLPHLLVEGAFLCGTDRCLASVIQHHLKADILLNIQGDQPFLDPAGLQRMTQEFKTNVDVDICSLRSHAICTDPDPDVVKVQVDEYGFAQSFTREHTDSQAYYHIGVYGFKSSILNDLAKLRPSQRELSNSLEQLRWMDHGYRIKMVPVGHIPRSIDNQDQLKALGDHDR